MTRKKVKLAFIEDHSARRATYKKRLKGLMKKASELSTLCGVDACAIIYGPYESQPQVWPSQLGAQRVLTQFMEMPVVDQSKKMLNHETFLKERIEKANGQLKKQRKDNRMNEVTRFMYQSLSGTSLKNLTMADLKDLEWLVERNLTDIDDRVDTLSLQVQAKEEPIDMQQTPASGTSSVDTVGAATRVHDLNMNSSNVE